MNHIFDIEIAEQYGVYCAIMLNNMYFWIQKNETNDMNYHDGRYWTFNSVKAFEKQFPYLSGKQIRSTINKLIDDGLIIDGNYNSSAYDRTKWYAITEKGYSILHHEDLHLPKWSNGIASEGKPIPDINTDINTDINNIGDPSQKGKSNKEPTDKEIEETFSILWSEYPRKKGKGSVSKTQKKRLYKIGQDKISKCIEKYRKEIDGKDIQYVMYGSTFFNTGYIDYLDDVTDKKEPNVTAIHSDRPERWRNCPDALWEKFKPYAFADGSFNWGDFDASVLTESDRAWMAANDM